MQGLLDASRIIAEYALTVWMIPLAEHIIGAFLLFFIGVRVTRIVSGLLADTARRNYIKPAQIDLLTASVTAIGWILIIAGVLQVLELNQLALAVGGSISLAALGIATGASGNLGDIIAGIFLASDPDFGAGFLIKTGDIEGVIEHIDLRKTRVRASDGKLHIIPNKMVEGAVWIVEQRPTTASHPSGFAFPTIPNLPPILRGRTKSGDETPKVGDTPTKMDKEPPKLGDTPIKTDKEPKP